MSSETPEPAEPAEEDLDPEVQAEGSSAQKFELGTVAGGLRFGSEAEDEQDWQNENFRDMLRLKSTEIASSRNGDAVESKDVRDAAQAILASPKAQSRVNWFASIVYPACFGAALTKMASFNPAALEMTDVMWFAGLLIAAFIAMYVFFETRDA